MHKRWGERFAGIFLVTLFSAAGALGLSAAFASRAQADAADSLRSSALALLRGDSQAAFQKRYDKALALRRWAVTAVGEARWALFGQGYPGVLAGSDSWLFSTEEFEDDLGYADEEITSFIAKARDRLKAKGIALLVVPLPAKARIYANYLPAGLRLPHEGRYESLLSSIAGLGLSAVNVEAAFKSYDGGRDLFLRGDTHWSPEGAQLAARLTAAAIQALPAAEGFPRADYRVRELEAVEHRGDLLAFLPESGVPWRPLPPPESLRDVELVASGAGGVLDAMALFGAQVIPLSLVGTSYSASSLWHFEDFLKAELSCDVLNLSTEGEGPYKPLLKALESSALEDNGVRVLVWELPERYVPVRDGA